MAKDKLEQAQLGQAPLSKDKDTTKESTLEALFAKTNVLREQAARKAALEKAQSQKNAMYANIIQGVGGLAQAQVQRDTGIDVGLKPVEFVKPKDVTKDIYSQRDSNIKDLQDQYKMIRAKNAYDKKATLDLRDFSFKKDQADKLLEYKKDVEKKKNKLLKGQLDLAKAKEKTRAEETRLNYDQQVEQNFAKEGLNFDKLELAKVKEENRTGEVLRNYDQKGELSDDKLEFAREKLKAESGKNGTKPSKLELARKNADLKSTLQIEKENRKERKVAQKSYKDLDNQIANVRKAMALLKKSRASGLVDTGPLDQYAAGFSDKGQELRQIFNEISLSKMAKLFEGMSKSVDSDAERRFFERSQVSMGSYPDVNSKILADSLKNLLSLKSKTKSTIDSISKTGEFIETQPQFVEMIAPNGQVARVSKDQVDKYLKKGATLKE